MDNDIKKAIRFEAGKKLTKEEKKEVYKELKDSYRVNLRPHTVENDKIVWLFEASDYMTKSDITGRLLRWYIYLPDGRIAHPTEVFGASMPVSEVQRVQNNIEYNERQSDIKYNEVVKLLKERGEIQKVINGIETALNNGAKFEKEFDSNDIGKKNPSVWLKFVIGAYLSVPQYIIKNLDEVYLGIDKDEFIKIKVEGLRNKYVNGSLSDIDWERFYTEYNKKQKKDMEKHTYALTLRPFDIGTYPKENFVRFVEEEADNYKFGLLEYSKELPIETIKHFSLAPVSDLMKYDGKEFYYYENLKAKAEILKNPYNIPYVKVTEFDENNDVVDETELFGQDFLENIKKGDYKIIDDSEAEDMETEKPKIGNVFGDLVLDRLEKAYKQRFPNDKFEREALIKIWNETKEERGIDRANSNLADIYLSYFDDDLRNIIYSDIQKEAKELEKGIAVEQEHLKTFEKVAAGDITPKQAIVETAQEHIAENTNYYDELEKIETPKIETMQETKLGNDDWAKIPAQNKYATPVKSKAYQYSPYDETFQTITDNFTISDGFRPDFSGVMFNELGISVVTAHRILYINHISEKYNGLYCVSEKCKKSVGDSYIKDDKIDRKSAPYQNYIPNASEFVYDIDLLALKTYCEIITRSGFVRKTTDFIALTFNDKKIIGINGKYLAEAINSFLIMGHRKVKVGINSAVKAILFVADNDYNGTESPIGKSDFFFIMPVISDSEEFNFAFMQGDIDMDTELNIAYSLEKDAVITKGGEVFHKIDTSITKKDVKDLGELSMEQLQIASSFINSSKKSILPILNTIKIENNTLNISNLEQAYSISDVKMPDGIYEIRGTALFPTKYDIDDFPKMPSDFKKAGQINRQELIKNFKHSLDFIGNDDLREIMKGVHFYKDAMNLVIESTDAHALYRNEIKNYNIDSEFNIIITKPKLVYKVLESFDCDDVDFYIQESGKNAYFECGTGKIYFFIDSGRYPNTAAIYPRDYEKKVVFEAKDLKKLEADIKILAKTSNYKASQILTMFNFTDGGTANYTLVGTYNEGSNISEHEELESGSIKCEVREDYSSLYSTFKTLIMPIGINNRNFNLGFRNFNLDRFTSLGFDKVELGYTKPERAVVVLNEFVLAGVKKVKNQKKKEVKKKAIIDVENETANIINEAFNEWDNISNESEHEKWSNKVSGLRFGTYKNQNILDVIVKFEPKYPNLVKKKDFITELYKALKIELPESLKPKMEIKPVIEDSEEVKEWKEAIENLNMLLEEGGTDAENSEWKEAIDNLNYLIEETPKMAKGGGVGNDNFYVKNNFGNFSVTDRRNNKMIVGYSKKEDANITAKGLNDINDSNELSETISKLKTMKGYGHFLNKMAKGGYLANENALMVANNNKQISHHTKEMAEALKGAKNVPAWVVAKVNRSASDLSDATHYLEGAEGMYAEGGEMKGKHYDMEKEIMESQFGKSI